MPSMNISLRAETYAALLYLVQRWHQGDRSKRNQIIQRLIIESAKREAQTELAERNAQ